MIRPFCLSQKKNRKPKRYITIKEIESLFLNFVAAMKAPGLNG